MGRLHGMGLNRGMAMGTAAVVRMRSGFPLLPPIPARIAELLSKRKMDETPDIILIAQDYRLALDVASSLSWGRVVGIVSAAAPPDSPISSLPAVINVSGLLDLVRDDMLLIVDADHNTVITDPDGIEVAQYQAEREKIAPRRRLFLDDVHLPAETLDGRAILVLARVKTDEDMSTALAAGADAIYVPFSAPILADQSDCDEQRRSLLLLMDTAAGKPLLLADKYALPPMLLLEASMRAEITLAVPLLDHLNGLGLGELGEELNEAQADCLANDAPCELPKLAVLVSSLDRLRAYPDLDQMAVFMDRLALGNAVRLVVDTELRDGSHYQQADVPLLDMIVAAANATMLPVIMSHDSLAWFPEPDPIENQPASGDVEPEGERFDVELPVENPDIAPMRFLLGAGVSGIITTPSGVEQTKAAIRELNFSECREALSELLSSRSS